MAKQEIKFKCVKDTNGCWSGKIVFTDGVTEYPMTVSAAPEMKNRQAKSFIKETLEEKSAEFLGAHAGWKMLTE